MTGQTDDLALLLAILGLVTSVGSLGWQVVTHSLTGSHIRCELRLAVHDDHHPAFSSHDFLAEGSSSGLAAFLNVDREAYPHEAALITVRNCGRTAVSVHYPVLDWGVSWPETARSDEDSRCPQGSAVWNQVKPSSGSYRYRTR